MYVQLESLHQPVDCTRNGQCARCGSCCSSILSVSEQEIKTMTGCAKANGFEPKLPDMGPDFVYMLCPFLITNPDETRTCAIYQARPVICQTFLCKHNIRQNAMKYQNKTGLKYGPAPINLWTLYGLTGIRIGGQDITPEQAGEATILDEDRNEYHIVAGQPLTFLLNNGQAHLHALVLTVTDTGFQFFDRDAGQVRWADYEDVQDIMKPRIQGLFDPDPE